MYTGIVQAAVEVSRVEPRSGLTALAVRLPEPLLSDLTVGASVGLAGVCLTVTAIEGDEVSFDAIRETLERTNLGTLREGSRVNVERSAKSGAEIGGHEISGHVDGTVTVVGLERDENNCVLTFEVPHGFIRYVFAKGFIALDGCSLTVVDVDRGAGTFTVHLIPETLRVTTFADLELGDRVNFEIERKTQVIVDTVRDFLRHEIEEGALPSLAGGG